MRSTCVTVYQCLRFFHLFEVHEMRRARLTPWQWCVFDVGLHLFVISSNIWQCVSHNEALMTDHLKLYYYYNYPSWALWSRIGDVVEALSWTQLERLVEEEVLSDKLFCQLCRISEVRDQQTRRETSELAGGKSKLMLERDSKCESNTVVTFRLSSSCGVVGLKQQTPPQQSNGTR